MRPVITSVFTLVMLAFLWTAPAAGDKVLSLPMRTSGPKSLDPVQGSSVYDNIACVQVYETLLVNSYADPTTLEPLLLESMPEPSEDRLTWTFTLRTDARFHDDPCFPAGRGRRVTPDDVFYSILRIFDPANGLKNVWLLENTIVGLDEHVASQADGSFDYDWSKVRGFEKVSDTTFRVTLKEPVYSFIWKLSMFQTSVVPREAVEHYGEDFFRNPVGTGPFILDNWQLNASIAFDRNPEYRDVRYPARDQWSREDRRNRLHRPAGERVPFVDRLEFSMFVEDQPMWLTFNLGQIGYVEVPAEYFPEAFDKRSRQLKPAFVERGVRAHSNELLDFMFRGFNMEDELVGGYTPEKKALRQAISLAIDLEEFNQRFYNGLNIVYDGPIPPGLDGHPENGVAERAYRGPDLARAREKLELAGYTVVDGKVTDLPPIEFYTGRGGNNAEQVELLKRQLDKVGIEIKPILLDFSQLISAVNKRKAPMFGFAWSSDYPDAENNLALFYSPNASPGSNHYNYSRPEYDALYERIRTMPPSPERTELYVQMRDMLLEDVPYVGSMARERFYLINPWLKNAKPTERFYAWYKFLDVDEQALGN